MKRWWNGDLVLEMLVRKVGKAEYYTKRQGDANV